MFMFFLCFLVFLSLLLGLFLTPSCCEKCGAFGVNARCSMMTAAGSFRKGTAVFQEDVPKPQRNGDGMMSY